MRETRRLASFFLVVFSVGLAAVFGGCEDPPPPPGQGAFLLGIRTVLPSEPNPTLSGGMGETLEGLTALTATVVRVDAVHRTDKDDPATEQVITIDTTEHTVQLQGDLTQLAPRQIGFFNIPPGFLFQLRFIVSEATITIDDEDHPVTIPSGQQSGLKVVPIDGVPFEIKADERAAARIVFQPFHQLIRNKGQGFIMKPVLEAEHVNLAELSPILLDRVVVRFHDGISEADINAINAEIGTGVIDRDVPTNYYILRLPTSVTLADALEFYKDRDEVRYTLPDFVVEYRLAACDPNYDSVTFDDIGAPAAWNVTTGSRKAIMAVADFGFDLKSRDMLPNWFINQDE